MAYDTQNLDWYIYQDGELVAESFTRGYGSFIDVQDGYFVIGRSHVYRPRKMPYAQEAPRLDYSTATIDDLIFYDRLLSQAEVKSIYQNP